MKLMKNYKDNQAILDQVYADGYAKGYAKIETAKKMLIEQRPIEKIMDITGLSKEKLNNIKY